MLLRRLFVLTLIAMFGAAPGHAAELQMHLSARVSTMCTVSDMRVVQTERGLMQIDASCNAASFKLVLGGDLTNLPIHSVSTAQGVVSVRGNTVVVRPERPGRFTFDVHYGTDLGEVRSAHARIEAI